MEKDLRDAYKALKLMRADLTRTKKEKQALEQQLSFSTQQPQELHENAHSSSSSNDISNRHDTEVTAALRATAEHARMQREDARAQLLQLQSEHQQLKQEHEALKHQHELLTASGKHRSAVSNQLGTEREPEPSADDYSEAEGADKIRSNQDEESEHLTVETEPIESHNGDDSDDHKQQQQRKQQDETSVVEEMVREKLGLLANLYSLKTKLDEQTALMLEQQATFTQERDELCLQLEELSEQLVVLQSHALDVENEKQFIEEKYDFLVTELQLIKQQRDDASQQESDTAEEVLGPAGLDAAEVDAAEDSEVLNEAERTESPGRGAVEAKLRELEAIREQLETERSVLQLQQQRTASVADREAASAGQGEQLASLSEALAHERSSSLGHEISIRRLEDQLRALEAENSDLLAAKAMLERDLEEAKRVSGEHERKLDALSQTNLLMQQQLQEKELEVACTKDEMQRQLALCRDELATAVQGGEQVSEELRSALMKEMEMRDADLAQRSDEIARLESELREQREAKDALSDEFQQQQTASGELQQQVEALQSERNSLREQTHALESELSVARESADRVEAEKLSLVAQMQDIQDQLQREIDQLKLSYEQRATELLAKLTSQQAQSDKLLKGSAMEVKALLQETRQLKQALKQREDELAAARSAADTASDRLLAVQAEQQQLSQQAAASRESLQRQLSALEMQLMVIEDKRRAEEDAFDDFAVVDDIDTNARAWAFITQQVRALDHFLPQLQSFAYFLDTALCLCEANASSLEALSLQHQSAATAAGNLTQDIVSFLRFVSSLQRGVGAASHVKQARRLHRQVLELLANWFECSEGDEIPAPPFTIASRETSLVLHNWTADKSKRLAAKHWLARMETLTPSSENGGSAGDGDEENLAADGSTLELQQMTMEVKQAFLMLIIPILKRNAAIYVRVFTRRALASSSSGSATAGDGQNGEDASWEMKIHVQLADTLLRRRHSVGRSASSPQMRARPPRLTLSSSSSFHQQQQQPDEQLVSTPTSAQKLQIIQERLQHMQKRGRG